MTGTTRIAVLIPLEPFLSLALSSIVSGGQERERLWRKRTAHTAFPGRSDPKERSKKKKENECRAPQLCPLAPSEFHQPVSALGGGTSLPKIMVLGAGLPGRIQTE